MMGTMLLENANLFFLLVKISKHNYLEYIYKMAFKNRHSRKLIGLRDYRI